MRKITEIIVHCSATRPSMDIGVKEIDGWHRANGWDGCGYHFVIRRNGDIETGRDIEKIGAHAYGHNTHSVGVCVVGGVDSSGNADANFTANQYAELFGLVERLKSDFPSSTLHGHREFSPKSCPSFDVVAFMQDTSKT